MFDGLYFEYPKVFTFIVIFIACDAYCKMRTRAIYFPHAAALTHETHALATLLKILKWMGISLLIVAMMSPVTDDAVHLAPATEHKVVFVVDAKSLTSFDVKGQITEMVRTTENSTFALVGIEERPHLISNLTASKKAFLYPLETLELLPSKSGDCKQALSLSTALLNESGIIIFMADKSLCAIDKEVIKSLSEKHITLYSLGEVEKVGGVSALHSYKVVDTHDLENALKSIRKEAGLNDVSMPYTFKTYYYIYPLFLAFLIFLTVVFLRNRRGLL